MTQPSILPYIHRFQALALLLTAAWLVLACSLLGADVAEPSGGTSSSAENGQTLQRDSELTRIRSHMLAQLRVDGVRLREAQAALDAAKDERSKDMHQAERDYLAQSLSRLYGQASWSSIG